MSNKTINLLADVVLPCVTVVLTAILFFMFRPDESTGLFWLNLCYTIMLEGVFFGYIISLNHKTESIPVPIKAVFGVFALYYIVVGLGCMLFYSLLLVHFLSIKFYVSALIIITLLWIIGAMLTAQVGSNYQAAQEKTDDWDRLVLFVAYAESQATVGPQVRAFTLTKGEYDDLPLVPGSETVHRYTLTVPAGTVRFYGLTFSSYDRSGLADKLGTDASIAQNFRDEAAIQDLSISNYYPYAAPVSDDEASAKTDVSKFCSVASGYYDKDGDGTPDDFTIDYSQIETDLTKIPTLTLRRLAAKIDVQWDAQAAYTDGDLVQPSVEGFQFIGRKEGKVFPELNKTAGTFEKKPWDFYNTTPISQRFGRVYHYTFPDGSLAPKVTFTVKTNTDSQGKQYTLQWNTDDYLQRATWYKVNATVKGNTTGGTISISGWNDGTSSPGN